MRHVPALVFWFVLLIVCLVLFVDSGDGGDLHDALVIWARGTAAQ